MTDKKKSSDAKIIFHDISKHEFGLIHYASISVAELKLPTSAEAIIRAVCRKAQEQKKHVYLEGSLIYNLMLELSGRTVLQPIKRDFDLMTDLTAEELHDIKPWGRLFWGESMENLLQYDSTKIITSSPKQPPFKIDITCNMFDLAYHYDLFNNALGKDFNICTFIATMENDQLHIFDVLDGNAIHDFENNLIRTVTSARECLNYDLKRLLRAAKLQAFIPDLTLDVDIVRTIKELSTDTEALDRIATMPEKNIFLAKYFFSGHGANYFKTLIGTQIFSMFFPVILCLPLPQPSQYYIELPTQTLDLIQERLAKLDQAIVKGHIFTTHEIYWLYAIIIASIAETLLPESLTETERRFNIKNLMQKWGLFYHQNIATHNQSPEIQQIIEKENEANVDLMLGHIKTIEDGSWFKHIADSPSPRNTSPSQLAEIKTPSPPLSAPIPTVVVADPEHLLISDSPSSSVSGTISSISQGKNEEEKKTNEAKDVESTEAIATTIVPHGITTAAPGTQVESKDKKKEDTKDATKKEVTGIPVASTSITAPISLAQAGRKSKKKEVAAVAIAPISATPEAPLVQVSNDHKDTTPTVDSSGSTTALASASSSAIKTQVLFAPVITDASTSASVTRLATTQPREKKGSIMVFPYRGGPCITLDIKDAVKEFGSDVIPNSELELKECLSGAMVRCYHIPVHGQCWLTLTPKNAAEQKDTNFSVFVPEIPRQKVEIRFTQNSGIPGKASMQLPDVIEAIKSAEQTVVSLDNDLTVIIDHIAFVDAYLALVEAIRKNSSAAATMLVNGINCLSIPTKEWEQQIKNKPDRIPLVIYALCGKYKKHFLQASLVKYHIETISRFTTGFYLCWQQAGENELKFTAFASPEVAEKLKQVLESGGIKKISKNQKKKQDYCKITISQPIFQHLFNLLSDILIREIAAAKMANELEAKRSPTSWCTML